MSAQEYLNEIKRIQKNLVDFIWNKANFEENYQNLIQIFDDIKSCDNKYKIMSLFHLEIKKSNYHYRGTDFFKHLYFFESFFHFYVFKFSEEIIFNNL